MYIYIIEFTALVLLMVGSWHAAKNYGRAFAQQWFVGAYLAAFIRETLNQTVFQTYLYSSDVVRIGAAPALITMLDAGIAYLAFCFALRFVDSTQTGFIAGLIFLIVASVALPIEATAAQMNWWVYTHPSNIALGVPLASLIAWGGGAAIFYAVFVRVRQSRLPEQGRFYAMVALAPIVAVGQLLLLVLL